MSCETLILYRRVVLWWSSRYDYYIIIMQRTHYIIKYLAQQNQIYRDRPATANDKIRVAFYIRMVWGVGWFRKVLNQYVSKFNHETVLYLHTIPFSWALNSFNSIWVPDFLSLDVFVLKFVVRLQVVKQITMYLLMLDGCMLCLRYSNSSPHSS